MNLSANLALTQSDLPLSLQVKGSQIDVASTRQMVLALAGKNGEDKDIFDIVGHQNHYITRKQQQFFVFFHGLGGYNHLWDLGFRIE